MRLIKIGVTMTLMVITAVCFTLGVGAAVDVTKYLEGADTIIGIYPGKNKVFVNNSVKSVSSTNTDIVLEKTSTVFVPVEFAAHMGAKVEKNGDDSAKISTKNIVIQFKNDSSVVDLLDSEGNIKESIDCGKTSLLYSSKLYIPLRPLADALGFTLYTEEDGMILLTSRALKDDEFSTQIAVARLYIVGTNITIPTVNLKEIDPNSITPTQVINTVKTGVVNADALRMRETPNGTVIKTLVLDEKVYILGSKKVSGTTWYQIRTQGWCYGYVMSEYIKSVKTETIDMSFGFNYYLIDRNTAAKITFKNNASGVKYSSSNKNIATVDSKGMVLGIRPGLVTITATYGTQKSSYVLVVCNTTLNTNVTDKKISDKGTNFIAVCEGGKSADGRFHKYQDVAGYWTIGYGHLIQPGEEFPESISAEEAEALLHNDLNEGTYVKSVNEFAKKEGLTLTQSQFDSLVSFAFNLGSGYFGSGMDMYYLKATLISSRIGSKADSADIYEGFKRYHYAGGKKYVGLYTRRMDEAEMFVKGDYNRENTTKWPVPNDGGTWY